jgi:HPt (histidine-containing phosphotransfer) domain-containing protein
MSEEPIDPLDPKVIAELRELAGDDGEFLREMTDLFLGSTAEKVPAIEGALKANRLAEAAAHAHQLKSASGNLGALRLADAFAQLEAAALKGDPAASATAFGTVSTLLPDVRTALKKLAYPGTGSGPGL